MKNKLLISVLAATTLISSAYALESFGIINSIQTIDTIEVANGRIHDYFNGTDKDVFVENYMTGDDATYIYARIQLREYMEYGENNKIILRGDIQNPVEPISSNEDTWDIFQYKASTKSPIRTYKDLKLGGKSVYMPTFNQDSTNKEIDSKGSLSDANGNIKSEPYDDYRSYNVDDKESGTIITAGNQSGVTRTHTAAETNTAIIYTMEEWFNAGSPIQNAWVFDTDGWAYYAAPIPAGSTSGLLIDEVLTYKSPTESWYYAVNVNGQLATAGDWGHNDDSNTESSMYANDMTDEGVYVLNKAAGLITVDNMQIKDSDGDSLSDDDINLSLGDSIQYRVSFNVINGIGDPDENLVTWSVSEPTGTLIDIDDSLTVDGLFTPSDKMKGYEFVITVTSQLDTRKSQSISVFCGK